MVCGFHFAGRYQSRNDPKSRQNARHRYRPHSKKTACATMAVRRSASAIAGAGAADQQAVAEDEDQHVPLVAARRSSSTTPAQNTKLLLGTCGSLLALVLVFLLSSGNNDGSIRTDGQKAHILELALQLTPIATQVVHRHGDRTPITPLTDRAPIR